MSWFRVDDGFHSHPKALAVSLSAIGLWTMVGSFCSRHRTTNGVIAKSVLTRLFGRTSLRLATELVSAGLWVESEESFAFHDWNQNRPEGPSKSEVSDKRREAGKRGAEARWQNGGFANGKPDGNLPMANDGNADHPIPTHPNPIEKTPSESAPAPPPRPVDPGSVSQIRVRPKAPQAPRELNDAQKLGEHWKAAYRELTKQEPVTAQKHWVAAAALVKQLGLDEAKRVVDLARTHWVAEKGFDLTLVASQVNSIRGARPAATAPSRDFGRVKQDYVAPTTKTPAQAAFEARLAEAPDDLDFGPDPITQMLEQQAARKAQRS